MSALRWPWQAEALDVFIGTDALRVSAAGAASPEFRVLDGRTGPAAAAVAAQVLLDLIASRPVSRVAVRAVVSDAWLQPLVLPQPPEGLTDDELARLVEAQVGDALGLDPAEWSVRWTRQRGGALLAVACPAALSACPARAGRVGLRWRACIPASVDRLGAVDLQGAAADSWLLLLEARSMSAVRVLDAAWQAWRVLPAEGIDVQGRAELFLRAVAQAGATTRTVALVPASGDAGASAMRAILQANGWQARVEASA